MARGLAVTVLLSACLVGLSRADPVGKQCPAASDPNRALPSCVCEHPEGRIDLRPLAAGGSKPKFTGVEEKDPSSGEVQFKFDYNPCYTFNLVDPCTNVYICQENAEGTSSYKIADSGTEQIYIDDSQGGEGNYVYYSSPTDDGNVRETYVTLKCNHGLGSGQYKISTTGDSQTTLLYRFTLESCHACPGGGCSSGGGIGVLGYAGFIIIFLGILALVLYFIIGAVILKVRFQKTGSDIIPNKGFWCALPVLIKDGVKLTFSPCLKLAKKKEGYESM